MADETTSPLDIAKFNLEAYKTAVELQMAMMKAYADYNFRMMEVLQKQVEIEVDILKLNIMRDAFDDYQRARIGALRKSREQQDEVEKFELALKRLNFLALGETSSGPLIGFGWRGFHFLRSRCPVTALTQMAQIKCTAADRKGSAFARPAFPNQPVADAPSDIKFALVLMDWAQKLQAVPRIGSKPYQKLGELLTLMGSEGKPLLADAKKSLAKAEKELKRIREMNWKNVDISNEAPKEADTPTA